MQSIPVHHNAWNKAARLNPSINQHAGPVRIVADLPTGDLLFHVKISVAWRFLRAAFWMVYTSLCRYVCFLNKNTNLSYANAFLSTLICIVRLGAFRVKKTKRNTGSIYQSGGFCIVGVIEVLVPACAKQD